MYNQNKRIVYKKYIQKGDEGVGSKKDIIFEYMTRNAVKEGGESATFDTVTLAAALNMQRTNLSTLLNELAKEGRVEKLGGRPVLYRLPVQRSVVRQDTSAFRQLIGWNGSLRNVIQLAKAAILYPEHSLHTIILGPGGSGKTYFAYLMAEFARENGVIAHDAPYVKFNCRYYEGKEEEQEAMLFGGEGEESVFQTARGGVLFLDHIDFLTPRVRNALLDHIERDRNEEGDTIIICAADEGEHKSALETVIPKFPVRIDMPALQTRGMEERFALIQRFFINEASHMHKTIRINAELLRCVLLYRCDRNVKGLGADIRIGCANAYVREFARETDTLSVYMNDFPAQVRKGFLYYRDARQEVEALIPPDYSYTFSAETMEKVEEQGTSSRARETIYNVIDRKISELRARGIQEEDISTIVNTDLEYDLKKVTNRVGEGNLNKESILKVVDRRIVNLTEQFMKEASSHLERIYPESTFYSLCLHLSAMLERLDEPQKLSNGQIMEVVENNSEEYAFCKKFAAKIEEQFDVKLPIDEVVFITMFLCDKNMYSRSAGQLAILIAMHGDSTATSMARVVNTIMHCENTHAFDLPLDKDMKVAYEELRGKLKEIDQGKGVFMLYDMGSLNTMAETAARESGVALRTMMIPSALIALDCARKADSGETLEELYQSESELYMTSYRMLSMESIRQQSRRVIITLCQSGKGGALQMKSFLEKHLTMEGVEIVPLAVSDRKLLLRDINNVKKDHEILAVVGAYDPKLMGIPFIPVARLFETPVDHLELLFAVEGVAPSPDTLEFTAISDYLGEQLKDMDVKALEKLLPTALAKIKKAVDGLSQDQELGLYMHIACAIYRMKQGETMPLNVNKAKIIGRQKRLYNDLRDFLRPLEEKFEITFGDDEMAHIIGIIKEI